MHEVFKRRQLAERIVLKAATQELGEVISLGITRKNFIGEFHADFFDYIISLDKIGVDISKPEKHIAYMENPTPKFKAILDIYGTDTEKHNLFRMVEVLIQWSDFDTMKDRAQTFVHRLDTWDFKEPAKVMYDLADKITEVGDANIDDIFLPNYIDEVRDELFKSTKRARTIETGICYLDRKLSGGFKTGKLYTVAARTGCGKTAFATNIALTAAKQGYNCLYVTLEMTRNEITYRLLSTESAVPIEKFDNSAFTQEEHKKVSTSLEEIKSMPISVYSKSKGDWAKVENHIRTIKRKRGLHFVVVDYIQQYSCPSRGFRASDKRHELDYMTGRFKQLALELDFAAIMLAQLNREIDKDSAERPPRLSDIKESSSIEQDSDVVLMLFCTNQKRVDSGDDEEKIIGVKIAKNRSGNVGVEELKTKLSINKFYPL